MNYSSFEARNRVLLPWWSKHHIVERHFPAEEPRVGEERSLFDRYIPPHIVFNRAVGVIRSGLRPSKKEGRRCIYFYNFDFIVGIYLNRQGIYCETDRVKIVCSYTECHQCQCYWPEEIITIYPVRNPFYHP